MTPSAGPLLLVTVGTDHHPFDRLVRWVDGWLGSAEGRVAGLRCLMQTGTSAPPRSQAGAAQWQAYLEFEALQAAMRDAAAVVCHGGPGTILGARHMGAVPIVVPRQHRLGEHVDDHQVAFSRRLAAEGSVFLAESEADLRGLLERVAVEPAAFRASAEHRGTAAAVRAFERLVDDLVAGRPDPPRGLAPKGVPR
ncbi:MAG TPA: glycosyltransferase [Actinomycetota bacterium]|nr:glycosyltransferase [Actinomycetota bacterium]